MLGDGGRVRRGNCLAAVGGSVEEELKDEREMSLVVYLSFPPLPSLSQLLILRPQVGREELKGIPNKRVPIVTSHQIGAAVPGSSLVCWKPPIF